MTLVLTRDLYYFKLKDICCLFAGGGGVRASGAISMIYRLEKIEDRLKQMDDDDDNYNQNPEDLAVVSPFFFLDH